MTDLPSADERLADLRTRTAQWIGSADQKASALLSLCGTVLALATLAFALPKDRPSGVAGGALVVFVITDVVAAAFALSALWPRTDRRKILGATGIKDGLPASPSFFADLGALTGDQFQKLVEEATADTLARDAREQAIVLCRIARDKMGAMKWAIRFVFVALLALAVGAIGAGCAK